jgi:hypothetical protein
MSLFLKEHLLQLKCFKWRLAIFVLDSPIHLSLRNLSISPRKIIHFRSFKSSTLFQCEDWVSFWKEYIFSFRIFKLEKGSFFSKKPIWLSCGKTCVFPNNTIHASRYSTSTLFPYENCISIWKEYFWQHLNFNVWIVSVCSKQVHSAEFKMKICLLKECHLCLKLNQLAHCLIMRI